MTKLTLLDGFEIVFVAFESTVYRLMACLGRRVVEIVKEKRPAVLGFGLLATTVDLVSLGVDERDFTQIARISDAEGVRLERA